MSSKKRFQSTAVPLHRRSQWLTQFAWRAEQPESIIARR
jgi:hypothetical protein